MHPKVHEKTLRECNKLDTEQDIDFKLFALELSRRLVEALKPFILSNIGLTSPMSLLKWYEDLCKVFTTALNLQAHVSLQGDEYAFRLPCTDEPFDPDGMITEYGNVKRDERVHVALFPSLVRMESLTAGVIESMVFPAVVLLR